MKKVKREVKNKIRANRQQCKNVGEDTENSK